MSASLLRQSEQKRDAEIINQLAHGQLWRDRVKRWLQTWVPEHNSPGETAFALLVSFTDSISDDIILRRGNHAQRAGLSNWKHHQVLQPILTEIRHQMEHDTEGPGGLLCQRGDRDYLEAALKNAQNRASMKLEARYRNLL